MQMILSKAGTRRVTHLQPEFFKPSKVFDERTHKKIEVTPKEKALQLSKDLGYTKVELIRNGKIIMTTQAPNHVDSMDRIVRPQPQHIKEKKQKLKREHTRFGFTFSGRGTLPLALMGVPLYGDGDMHTGAIK